MSDAAPAPAAATADRAARLVAHLMTRDAFSQWLGLEVLHAEVGRARLRCTVRDDMVNGFGIAHGGVLFSLADSAFAVATNGGGTLSGALDCTVSFPMLWASLSRRKRRLVGSTISR